MALNMRHHLNVRSDFSIGESMLQVGQIADAAKELGYESVMLMDTMTVSSMVPFALKARKAGVRPNVGVRLRVYEDPTYRKPKKGSDEIVRGNFEYTLKVYILSDKGMRSVLRMLSKANTPEHFYYNARVGLEDVLELEDVAVSTGDFYNVFHYPKHEEVIQKLLLRFGGDDRLFCEVSPINTPLWDTLNKKSLECAKKFGLPTLATYPAMYLDESHFDTMEVLSTITTPNMDMNTRWRSQQFVHDFVLDDPAKLPGKITQLNRRLLGKFKLATGALLAESLKNVEVLAYMCQYEFKKQDVCLPKMAEDEFGELVKQSMAGWAKRFSKPVLGHLPEDLAPYKERLRFELSVLRDMGFSNYFLLVQDLVGWAKDNEIIVGPGRGSVGGSLVAYLLGITDVDPIRFGLFFERFINPERLDLPDADLDFMSTKRHLVVEHLREKYGADHVAGISNYSTLASASALRDTGRSFGMSGLELVATKLVPKEHGASFTLDEAAEAVPEIEKFKDENPLMWKHATRLEGAMRSYGQHAAGIVVAGEPLINRAVVESRKGGDETVVNWDRNSVESWGLVKMDILGLSTLDMLEVARQMIAKNHGKRVSYLDLPLDDDRVMKAFGEGNTVGVFQFESGGMRKLLSSLALGGQLTFNEITAATALYRPGPMDSGLLDDYVAIRQGVRSPSYEHPSVEKSLSETYGIMVYQEQVMAVARDLCGFTLAEADHLRKAIGKKDQEKMAEMRDKFVAGAINLSGIPERRASDLWDKIEMFAAYSFNKSHSVEYSIISYWCQWVKVNYPAEFYAAALTIVSDNGGTNREAKLLNLVKDARENHIELLPPDINRSTARFEVRHAGEILAPFNAVKGISENTSKFILEAREKATDGLFADKANFLLLVNKTKVNKRVQESLEKVGAYAGVVVGSLPSRHPDRLKDQMELMAGMIIDTVKADRKIEGQDKFIKAKLIHLINDFRSCEGCDLKDQAHPIPRLGKAAKFMVVFDCPSWMEEKEGKILDGDSSLYIKQAMKNAGLLANDGYFTTLVKAKKNDKFLSNGQINACGEFLKREIELLKPPVIVALGAAAIRYFEPTLKGGAAEHAGKVIFMPSLDASIVCGINPGQIAFDGSKAKVLDDIFAKVAEMVL